MINPPLTPEQALVAQRTERIIRDYMVANGHADQWALPKDYEDLVVLLEKNGLLVTNLERCCECENPALPGSFRCRGHHDLHQHL